MMISPSRFLLAWMGRSAAAAATVRRSAARPRRREVVEQVLDLVVGLAVAGSRFEFRPAGVVPVAAAWCRRSRVGSRSEPSRRGEPTASSPSRRTDRLAESIVDVDGDAAVRRGLDGGVALGLDGDLDGRVVVERQAAQGVGVGEEAYAEVVEADLGIVGVVEASSIERRRAA